MRRLLMFEIEFICEGVYDLWYHDGDTDPHGEYVGTYESHEIAQEEADAFALFHGFVGDYTL
jgi:hypothetical protein